MLWFVKFDSKIFLKFLWFVNKFSKNMQFLLEIYNNLCVYLLNIYYGLTQAVHH